MVATRLKPNKCRTEVSWNMRHSTQLKQAPLDNDVADGPDGISAYWVVTGDDVKIRLACWDSPSPKGTIFLFPGRTENIEKYGRTARKIVKLGYSVFAIDWRGQGLSDRLTSDPKTGHVGNFADYQRDARAMLFAAAELELPKPWFLIGHSLGGCIGLRTVMDNSPFSACVFTAPLWGINLPRFQRSAAWPLSWTAQLLGCGHYYAPGTNEESYVLTTPFSKNRLTHDAEMYEYYRTITNALPEQQIGGPSLQWLYQALKETRHLASLGSPKIPCLTFCGALDEIVDTGAVQNRMESWTNGSFELLKNAKHDVLYEVSSIRTHVLDSAIRLFEAQKPYAT